MLYIAVRLFCGAIVALFLLIGGLVGGGALQAAMVQSDSDEYIESPDQDAAAHTGLVHMPKIGKCSAPDTGATLVDTLEKLVRIVEPAMPDDKVEALASGSLLADALARIPDRNASSVDVAATVCVMRLVNDDNQVVWRVELKLPQ